MKKIIYSLLLIGSLSGFTQKKPLDAFKNLMDKTWSAEGKWGDGSNFKQAVTMSYDLNNKLVIAKSNGFIDLEQTQFGSRNHGIRQYDQETGKILFWEFDVFGGLTQGEVKIDGKDFIYIYSYGESTLADIWKYVDDSTYDFTVMNYEDNKPGAVYLKTQFKSK